MWMANGYGMGAAGWVLMAVFWVTLVALIWWAVARLTAGGGDRGGRGRGQAEDPREILGRRLASGEIDVETYERLRSKLEPRPAGSGG